MNHHAQLSAATDDETVRLASLRPHVAIATVRAASSVRHAANGSNGALETRVPREKVNDRAGDLSSLDE